MAALDPTEEPQADDEGNIPAVPRSTLKLIRKRPSLNDELDDEFLNQFMGGGDSDEDDDEEDSDEEANGGPSDPSKSKKARREAALQKLIQAVQEEDSDEEMEDDDAKPKSKANGVAKATKKGKKGKEPATSSDDEDDDESIDSTTLDLEELVVCTLDTERVCLALKSFYSSANVTQRTTNNPSTSPLALTRRSSSLLRVLTPFT